MRQYILLSILLAPFLLAGQSFVQHTIQSGLISDYTFLHVNDVDSDGFDDLITYSDESHELRWLQNTGSGLPSTSMLVASQVLANQSGVIVSLSISDYDGDGLLEILYASGNELRQIVQVGPTTFGTSTLLYAHDTTIQSFLYSDLDSDTDMDLVISEGTIGTPDGFTSWHQNDGSGVYTNEYPLTDFVTPHHILQGDMDGDGINEIFIDGLVLGRDASGTYVVQNTVASSHRNNSSLIDIDNDGDLDYVGVISWYLDEDVSTLDVMLNASGELTPIDLFDNHVGTRVHCIDDFDLDGTIDVMLLYSSTHWASNQLSNLQLVSRFGDLEWLDLTHTSLASDFARHRDMVCMDVDSDGVPDLVVSHEDGSLSWFENPHIHCPTDLSGDGITDINDFLMLNSAYGQSCDSCAEDITKDGTIDINDFLVLNTIRADLSLENRILFSPFAR